MSSDVVIRVESLSKKYSIGSRSGASGHGLRHALQDMAGRMWRAVSQPQREDNPSLEDFWALKDVSFEVNRGEVLGIIGRNGAGKSTLLKILSRITEPTTGRIGLKGRVASLLEVGTGFHHELTGRENVYLNGAILGMNRAEVRQKFDAIVNFAGVDHFLDTPVKHYSSGMYVRLAFAVAAHLEPDILVVDEVLAVGDAEFQQKCLGKMHDVANSGKTVLFVSHNLPSILELTTRGLLLEKGRVAALGPSRESIARYLKTGATQNEFSSGGPLRRVKAEQTGQSITISAEYAHDSALALPNFGFVVSDRTGNPVFGSNPRLCGIDKIATPAKAGSLAVEISKPALLDGTYNLSVWFGDGSQDFTSSRDCLTFQVTGQAGPRQHSAQIVGSVEPTCHWHFSPGKGLDV